MLRLIIAHQSLVDGNHLRFTEKKRNSFERTLELFYVTMTVVYGGSRITKLVDMGFLFTLPISMISTDTLPRFTLASMVALVSGPPHSTVFMLSNLIPEGGVLFTCEPGHA